MHESGFCIVKTHHAQSGKKLKQYVIFLKHLKSLPLQSQLIGDWLLTSSYRWFFAFVML
jgi:hypothetical protein